MSISDGALAQVKLTAQEMSYLQSFLTAGDRAGFYMAYYSMVASDKSFNLAESDVGKDEASLQAKISSFSQSVGAAAYISNRLLQQIDPAYPGIYTLSQQVAQHASQALVDHDNNLISDAEFFESAEEAWRRALNKNGERKLFQDFPGLLLQGGVPHVLAQSVASLTSLCLFWGSTLLSTGNPPDRSALVTWLGSQGSDRVGEWVAALAGVYVYAAGLAGKDVDSFSEGSGNTIIITADGEQRLAVDSHGKVVAVELRSSGSDSGTSKYEALNGVMETVVTLVSVSIPSTLPVTGGVTAAIKFMLDPFFHELVPPDWSTLTYPTGEGPNSFPASVNSSDPPVAHRASATSGSDTLSGTSSTLGFGGADTIHGLEGDDAVFGGSGSDTLFGDAGNDILWGQDDDDTLDGGGGNDVLRGGDGNDTLAPGTGEDYVDGGTGRDVLDYQGFGRRLVDIPTGIELTVATSRSESPSSPSVVRLEWEGNVTRALNVEYVKLTDSSDTVHLGDLGPFVAKGQIPGKDNPLAGLKIDFGLTATPAIDDDKIDVTGLTYTASRPGVNGVTETSSNVGVRIDLSDRDKQTARYRVVWGDGSVQNSEVLATFANANAAVGTDKADILFGAGGRMEDGGYSSLRGGGGNDILYAAGHETHMWGGAGSDNFDVGANTIIEDGSIGSAGKDTITYGSMRIYGGVKQAWMQGNFAYWAPFGALASAFPVIGAEMIYTAAILTDVGSMKFARFRASGDGALEMNLGWGHGGTAAIKNYYVDPSSGAGTAGVTAISVGPERDGGHNRDHFLSYLNLALKAGHGIGFGGFDPLVLDLDGDGYNLTAEPRSNIYFEFDGDGFGEHTGWVRATDGFLVRDENANGKVDSVAEMFGNQSTPGFDMLGGYDSNLDGVISATDTVFAALQVWQDLDQDGVTDAGELKSLAELGIVSISLTNSAPAEPTAIGGNVIAHEGSFTRADGSVGRIADVALAINEADSRWQGDATISQTAAALPQIKGFGEIKDLRVAMTGDAVLQAQVAAFVASETTDLPTLKSDAEAILYRWAGVEGISPVALGADGFDTQKLAFLEKYSGYELMPRDSSGAIDLDGLNATETLWDDQVTRLTLRLVVQGPLADAFAGITYNSDRDLLVSDSPTALRDVLHNLIEDLPSSASAAQVQWANWAPLLGAVTDGMVRSDANVVTDDFIFAQLVAAADGVAQPLSLAQLADGLGIPDVRIGTAGNDTLARGSAGALAIYYSDGGNDILNGGIGQDVYVFGHQIGQVVINDIEPGETGDRIRFAFLAQSDVKMERSGNDLLITVKATEETIRVTGQFAPVVPFAGDVLLSTNKGVEDIQFADGSIMEIPEIMTAVGTGSDGDDHIVGTMHSDVFIGGKGDDLLEGGDDADLYVFNRGDGADIIQDVQSTVLLRAADLMIFGDDIAPEDLVFGRAGNGGDDLTVSVSDGGGSMLIKDQFDYTSLGYNHNLAPNSRIEVFGFREYGTSWSSRDIQQKLLDASTTDGDDTTRGFGDDDSFEASAGSDLLIGMDGADTYYWGKGAGNDTIDEQARYIDVNVGLGGLSLTVRADTVAFDPSLSLDDLVFSRPTAAPDLLVTNVATGETLTVRNQFAGFQTGVLGAQWLDRIEWFAFGDGSRLSWQDVEARVTTGGSGNDRLWGDILPDRMAGGAGNDTLSGKGGGDTYVFNSGDGHDTIDDANDSFLGDGFITIDGTPDVLELGPDILPSDITFARNGVDIDLIVGAGGDRITLKGQDDYIQTGVFGAVSTNRVEQVKFADGTIWTWDELNRRVIAATTTSGDDDVQGFTLEDRFEASAGDDILSGGDSADTYVFGVGSGHDTIRESVSHVLYGDEDVVEFAAPLLPADVAVSRDGDDLILTLASGDSLTVEGEFAFSAWYSWTDVELFKFSNGVTWTKADVQLKLLVGTPGADHLLGFMTSDTLDGAGGNDILEGADGSDTYVFGRGSGSDIIRESVSYVLLGDDDGLKFAPDVLPSDVALSRDGNDLVVTIVDTGDSVRIEGQFNFASWFSWNDVEHFDFADGTSWSNIEVAARLTGGTAGDDHILGTFRSDTLDGLAGDDILEGGDGSDIYVFGRGYGRDEIRETVTDANLGDDEELRFGPDITLADLGFERVGDDLVITIAGMTDSLKIVDQFASSAWYRWNDIERFTFGDGSTLTNEQVQQILLTPTAGNDHIKGFMTNDVLAGGAGDDILEGFDGSDSYLFNLGDGHDEIRESVGYVLLGDEDEVRFGPGITLADLSLARSGDDLIVTVVGTTDSLKIVNQFSSSAWYRWNDIERFIFADGSTLTNEQVQQILLTPTAGNDHIKGFMTNDVLAGGAGDDILEGFDGSDSYRFNLGDGHDEIRETVGYVLLGQDDELVFGTGITLADLGFARDGNDLVITVLGSGDSVRIKDQISYDAFSWNTVETFRFADGSSISYLEAQRLTLLQGSTAGDDVIVGFREDDTINALAGNDSIDPRSDNDVVSGGPGNDVIYESSGDDTYVWNIGDGDDIIRNYAFWDGTNTLQLGSGITASDIRFAYADANGDGLKVSVAGQPGSVTLEGQLIAPVEEGVDQIRFADGTVWTRAQYHAAAYAQFGTSVDDTLWAGSVPGILNGGSGNDTLFGRGANDTLDGGAGNDLLSGGSGDDVFRFARGGGQDIVRDFITNTANGGSDAIELSAGIAPSHITVTQADDGADLILKVNGTTDQITLDNTVSSEAYRIEQVRFADGTTWSYADLFDRSLQSSDGDDTLFGDERANEIAGGAGDDILSGKLGNDTLIGGIGNDTLFGNAGDDMYRFACGDGQDIVSEYVSQSSGFDTVAFAAGIAPSDISVSQADDGNDLILKINGTSDQITLDNTNNVAPDYQIDRISFADGTTWSFGQVFALSYQPTSGDDTFYGSAGNDVMSGGGGNDRLEGGAGDDRLAGDAGNDLLYGGGGNDIYVFGRGDGQDVVSEYTWQAGGNDVVEFRAGVAPADISIGRAGNGLDHVVLIAGASDALTLVASNTVEGHRIEQFTFADGTIWDAAAIQAHVVPGRIVGSQGDDQLSGSASSDTIFGRGGNDTMSGGAGGDSYLYDAGDGADVVVEADNANDFDTLDLGAGIEPDDVTVALASPGSNDLVLSFAGSSGSVRLVNQTLDYGYGVEQVRFADGTVWDAADLVENEGPDPGDVPTIEGTSANDGLYGTSGADIFRGGAGNDYLEGREGSDTYLYASGDGNDEIFDENTIAGGIDTLKLTDLNPADVTLRRDGVHLFVRDDTTGQEIKVLYQYHPPYDQGIEKLEFADGTVWDAATIRQNAWIRGNAENNGLYGSSSADTFVGGLGDDYMEGGDGGDTYIYTSGDGNDQIFDENTTPGGIDTLKLTNLNPTDVTLRRDGAHLFVRDNATGKDIKILYQYHPPYDQGIERLEFADGTVWDAATIQQNAWIRGDAANNGLFGSSSGDTLSGGSGNDYLEGLSGSDTYVYAFGDGSDEINDNSSSSVDVDVLRLADLDPADVTFSRDSQHVYVRVDATGETIKLDYQFYSTTEKWGIEGVEFANGVSWGEAELRQNSWYRGNTGNNSIVGTATDETIYGDDGSDYLEGRGGGDVYVYSSGDGNDEINDNSASTSDIDVLRLVDLNPADVTVSRDSQHVYVSVDGTTDVIKLAYQFYSSTDKWGIEKVEFADGTVWNEAAIRQHAWYRGTPGNDSIQLTSTDFIVDAGAGDDSLIVSGMGAGIFYFGSGKGHDTLENPGSGYNRSDTLILYDVTPDQVELTRTSDALEIGLASGDTFRINWQFWGDARDQKQGISFLEFADGTNWNADDIRTEANALGRSGGLNVIQGTSAANTLTGTSGDDLVIGLSGVDTMAAGAGNDYLAGGAGNDVLDGGAGIDVALFAGSQSGYTLATSGGTTTITDNQPSVDGDDGADTLLAVEKAEFGDGSQVGLASPIVLDLDRNGVSLVDRARSRTSFDWDSDGRNDRTGWIGKGDAFLVYDRDGDGKVSGANELSFVNDKPRARSDLDGLAAFDSDGDGILSASDEDFARFRVWRDANGNGRSDKGELKTLAAAGIASLNLSGTPVDQVWGWSDNVTVNTGLFTRSDGSQGAFADVALNYATAPRGVLPAVAAAQLTQAIAGFQTRGTTDLSFDDRPVQQSHMLMRPQTGSVHL